MCIYIYTPIYTYIYTIYICTKVYKTQQLFLSKMELPSHFYTQSITLQGRMFLYTENDSDFFILFLTRDKDLGFNEILFASDSQLTSQTVA